MVLNREELRNLLLSNQYKILVLSGTLEIKNRDDLRRVEDIALLVIKKYVDSFYRKYARRFETDNLRYGTVGTHKKMVAASFNLRKEVRVAAAFKRRK